MAKKHLIVTITIGDFYTKMAEITHPTLRSYASRIGADFTVLSDQGKHTLPHYRKLDLDEFLEEYDRVLYIDTDILVRSDAPNVFDIVPEEQLGIFEEGRYAERAIGMIQFLQQNNINPNNWNRKYYNTGVMVLSKCHKNLFLKPPVEQDHFREQTYLNMVINTFRPEIFGLPYKFNRLSILDKISGEQRFDSYFLHYAGAADAMPNESLLELIQKDLNHWKEHEGNHHYQKKIAVIVEGGLGDQIAAEPVVRYIRDVTYKGDDIVVVTDFPDVFDHIEMPVYKVGSPAPDGMSRYLLHTLRNPEHVSWEYMSHLLVQATDFAALQAIRCTLPIECKPIQQTYLPKHLDKVKKLVGDFNDLVLVHPGLGWDTKTFPGDVWRSYVDALLRAKLRVALIGKDISKEQGVVEFDRSGCIDLINQLSYKELVAAIANAPVLITNDSAPLHIAGAFENHIGIIATCKHPQYILPYRHGSQFWRAKALEKKGLYNTFCTQPSLVDGATVDKCDPQELRDCLPDGKTVAQFALDAIHPDYVRP